MSNPVDAPPSERSARANSPNTEQEKCGVDTLVDSKMNTDVKGDQSADVQSPEGTALLSDQTKLERQENHHEAGAELPSVNNKLGAQATGQSEYCPQDNDFTPNPVYIRSTDSTSLEYWESVLDQCVPETRLNAPKPGKRDIYGVGSLVIKYGHNSLGSTGDYSFLDENEETAVGLAAEALPELQLPKYYLRTRIRGQDTLVRSRIPGASLDSIWSSLGPEQKLNFKRQAQDIARRIHLVKLDSSKPSYLVNIPQQEKCAKPHLEERDILLGGDSPSAAALGLAHNNLLPSNIIVDNGKIVGLVGWSHTGNFELSRCGRVHCEIRCKDEKRNLVPELWEGGVPWYDLYETIQDGQNLQAAHTEKESQPFVKAEETAATISVVPHLAKSEIFNFPTPQKITDLKQESVSRASSMDRSSPAPSVKPAPKKRAGASAMSKKGQAVRKPAAKKRKLNDTESVDGTTGSRRSSATPSVRGKGTTRRGRKQTSMSLAGSPAPEGSARGKSQEVDDDLEEDEDNSSEVFCICRRPDNHTWMIACDGGCDDWFHGKCVNMKQADADLIDKYICKILGLTALFFSV